MIMQLFTRLEGGKFISVFNTTFLMFKYDNINMPYTVVNFYDNSANIQTLAFAWNTGTVNYIVFIFETAKFALHSKQKDLTSM